MDNWKTTRKSLKYMMPTTLSCPTTVDAINQSARSSEGEQFVV